MQQYSKQIDEIDELVFLLESRLTKAKFVQQEVSQNYFDEWNPIENADHRNYMAHEYKRYGTFSEIVAENLKLMEKDLEQLRGLISQVRQEPSNHSNG